MNMVNEPDMDDEALDFVVMLIMDEFNIYYHDEYLHMSFAAGCQIFRGLHPLAGRTMFEKILSGTYHTFALAYTSCMAPT